jgi:hypothetical protein
MSAAQPTPSLQTLLDHSHVADSDSTTQYQDNSSTHNANRPLSRHHVTHFDFSHKCAGLGVKDKFNIEGILIRLNVIFPEMDFLQYEEKLRGLGIYYLESANMFETDFYESNQVGMTGEATGLFRQYVSTEYLKALLAHERAKCLR